MNIFFLHTSPKIAALNLNHNKLYEKMYIEAMQMLCTTYRMHGIEEDWVCYKKFNPAHESRMWLEESEANVLWACKWFTWIVHYGRLHPEVRDLKVREQDPYLMIKPLIDNVKLLELPDSGELTLPFLAMKNNAPDLVEKYGTPVELISPVSGKANTAYRAKTFQAAVTAYRLFMQRKEYWKPEYRFYNSEPKVLPFAE